MGGSISLVAPELAGRAPAPRLRAPPRTARPPLPRFFFRNLSRHPSSREAFHFSNVLKQVVKFLPPKKETRSDLLSFSYLEISGPRSALQSPLSPPTFIRTPSRRSAGSMGAAVLGTCLGHRRVGTDPKNHRKLLFSGRTWRLPVGARTIGHGSPCR